MMKKLLTALLALSLLLNACSFKDYGKYEYNFHGVFDTYITITGYAKNKEEFDSYVKDIRSELEYLHKLYDIYNDYPGINNIKTINDNAGKLPVEVDGYIIDLINLGIMAHEETEGNVNIALGSVLNIWHKYRINGIANPAAAQIPPMELLKEAADHISIEDIVIDEETSTVFLKDENMLLDVGSIAKGYAIRIAGDIAFYEGFEAFVLNGGGNVYIAGEPKEAGKQDWRVGVLNPLFSDMDGDNIFDTIGAVNVSVVTSGSYQRFYRAGGKKYNHIIDPATLMPADLWESVTIVHKDSSVAEILSTALFIMPYEDGVILAEKYGAEVLWIRADGSVKTTDGYKAMSDKY